MIMSSLLQLEKEIDKIKDRNKRVEIEKEWETSWTRRIIIILVTYAVISLVFIFMGTSDPFKNAIIPSIGFIISTLSGPFIKNIWLKRIRKQE